ncbi:TPA: hypothetical protein NJ109_001997 [Vibrio parahaemolyticus]|nr:hypothetical protein [Vibrio parahaemolyticus]HCH2589880.1 hypothetical protein [Vibrio parahaemolyticus]
MGLKIHSIAEIPETVSRSYYMYVLDYYNWDEPIANTLRANFDRMAEFASKNDAVVIQPVGESHFFSELLSWEGLNGMAPEDILPAIMVTTIHPKYFLERDNQRVAGEPTPNDKLLFIELKGLCNQPSDVLKVIEQLFSDIKAKKEIKNFQIKAEQKAGIGGALVDSLILEPNFAGVGVDLKKAFSIFKRKKA